MRSKMVALLLLLLASVGHAQAPVGSSAPKTVWYFYSVKWGYQDEFQALFARNHLPVLREEITLRRRRKAAIGGDTTTRIDALAV